MRTRLATDDPPGRRPGRCPVLVVAWRSRFQPSRKRSGSVVIHDTSCRGDRATSRFSARDCPTRRTAFLPSSPICAAMRKESCRPLACSFPVHKSVNGIYSMNSWHVNGKSTKKPRSGLNPSGVTTSVCWIEPATRTGIFKAYGNRALLASGFYGSTLHHIQVDFPRPVLPDSKAMHPTEVGKRIANGQHEPRRVVQGVKQGGR
jgi:hypothetical protein